MKTPYAHTPPRTGANAYLRRERDRRRRRELMLVVLAVLPLGVGLLLYTWVELETLAAGYRITRLEDELHRLRREAQDLSLAVADRSRPEVIEARATERLGMAPQTHAQTLYSEELP